MADTTIDLLKNSSYVGKMDELIAAVKSGGGTASDVEWNNVKNKPTTIGGYGITDAKIENGTITLGNQTITPLTSAPVTSVNSQTGAVVLTANDVSAIPSTLTGTAGQVLTKTADGQEWKDVDIPNALPNPNALTFTGAVTGSYDGSAAVTVEIPSGGGGGITGFRRVVDTTLTEAAETVNLTTDINGNAFSLSECYLFIEAACTEPDTITYIPNGYWTAGTYMISGSKTATDYPYIYIAYACGGSDHFFGFELRHRTGVSMPNYNSNKSANWIPITSYKLAGKFAKGARFIIFGRDA